MFILMVPHGTKRFKTLVEARAYAVKLINYKAGFPLDIYEAKKGKKARFLGEVHYNASMAQYYYGVPDRKDQFTGQQYFKSRPIHKNGKLAGRF